MAPAQLSRQCRDNLCISKHLCELNHAPKAFFRKPSAIRLHQLCRQRRHNLFTIVGAGLAQHFTADALTHLPIQQGLRTVGRAGHMRARLLNELAHIVQQSRGGVTGCMHGLHHGPVQITVRPISSPASSSCRLASCSSALSPTKQELSSTTCAGRAFTNSSFSASV